MKTSKPELESAEKLLIVEGDTDKFFFVEVLKLLDKSGIFIESMRGLDRLTKTLPLFLTPDRLESKQSIAVIVDADHDAKTRVASLEDLLRKVTNQDVKNGQWTAGPPRVGLFVVPGDGKKGEIESLVWEAWSMDPANGDAAECIHGFLSCMEKRGHKAKSPDKGRINAMLSVLCDEDPRLGAGARQRLFDFRRPQYAPLIEFLRQF